MRGCVRACVWSYSAYFDAVRGLACNCFVILQPNPVAIYHKIIVMCMMSIPMREPSANVFLIAVIRPLSCMALH